MAEKSVKTRIQMKRGTSADWALATGFKPLEGEYIFYTDLNKIKVGKYAEGTTDEQKKSANHTDYLLSLSDLEFLKAGDADTLDGKHASEFALKTDIISDTNQKVKTGNVTFNANDTVEFAAGTNVSITGDTTNKKITISSTDSHNSHAIISGKKADGSTDIKSSASSGDITLGDSGVTAGEYGPTSDQTPGYGATFNVPDIKVNSKGIVTSVTNRTVKIPASDNSETTLTITDKTNTDTTDLVYAVTNIVESGTKGHTITSTYTGLPTKTYVDKVATGHVKYLGTVAALTSLSTTAGQGDFYRVSTQFTFGSETAHVGDIILATKDNPTQNVTDWDLIHTEVDANTWVENKVNAAGYVTAPGTSNINKVWKTDGSGNPGWRDDANTDTGATSVEVTGTGNVVTAASYNATNRKLTLTKGATTVSTDTIKTEVESQVSRLISSGITDPIASTTGQYYFKY